MLTFSSGHYGLSLRLSTVLALRDGILDPNDWNFYFVGKDPAPINLNGNVEPGLLQNIKWAQYRTLVSSMDLVHRLISGRHTAVGDLADYKARATSIL